MGPRDDPNDPTVIVYSWTVNVVCIEGFGIKGVSIDLPSNRVALLSRFTDMGYRTNAAAIAN